MADRVICLPTDAWFCHLSRPARVGSYRLMSRSARMTIRKSRAATLARLGNRPGLGDGSRNSYGAAVCLQRNEQVNSAAAELDLGQRELARARRLKESGAITVQALDLATNQVEVLEDQLASTKFALKVAEYELEQAKRLSFMSKTSASTPAG